MSVKAIGFNPRIMTALKRANVKQEQLANVARCPFVLKRFYLITPHALLALENDLPLLRKLEVHFARNRGLSFELKTALKNKGLSFNAYGAEDHPYCYRVYGTNTKEQKLIREMHDEFMKFSIFDDVVMCFKQILRIELRSQAELNQGQIQQLTLIFDPRTSDALHLLNSRGISKIVITNPVSKDDRGISIESEEPTNQLVLFIPSVILGDPIEDAALMVLGALAQ